MYVYQQINKQCIAIQSVLVQAPLLPPMGTGVLVILIFSPCFCFKQNVSDISDSCLCLILSNRVSLFPEYACLTCLWHIRYDTWPKYFFLLQLNGHSFNLLLETQTQTHFMGKPPKNVNSRSVWVLKPSSKPLSIDDLTRWRVVMLAAAVAFCLI